MERLRTSSTSGDSGVRELRPDYKSLFPTDTAGHKGLANAGQRAVAHLSSAVL